MNKKYITIPLVAMMSLGINGQAASVLADDNIEVVHNIDTKETNYLAKKSTTKQAIKKLNKTMYATTAVNVRNKPSSKGKKLGTLRFSQKVKVTGQDKNTGWYQIKYKGKIGYVSGSYLSTSKPSSGSTSKPSSGSTSKPNNDDRYETDCVTGADDWLSGKADCHELPDGAVHW